jgi:hypothetical protein
MVLRKPGQRSQQPNLSLPAFELRQFTIRPLAVDELVRQLAELCLVGLKGREVAGAKIVELGADSRAGIWHAVKRGRLI